MTLLPIKYKVQKNCKGFEDLIKNVEKQYDKAFNKISEIDNKFTKFEQKQSTINEEVSKTKQNSKIDVEVVKQNFNCDKCKFTTESENGLKVHCKTKHANLEYPPYNCEFCEKSFGSESQLKSHLKTHSYSKVIKCENCSFFATNDLSLKVHVGKEHSGDHECGLCGFSAASNEQLKIHLHTCEIYICCASSDETCKTISEIKKHLTEKHKNWLKETIVTHAKISRTNSESVDTKNKKGSTFF